MFDDLKLQMQISLDTAVVNFDDANTWQQVWKQKRLQNNKGMVMGCKYFSSAAETFDLSLLFFSHLRLKFYQVHTSPKHKKKKSEIVQDKNVQ